MLEGRTRVHGWPGRGVRKCDGAADRTELRWGDIGGSVETDGRRTHGPGARESRPCLGDTLGRQMLEAATREEHHSSGRLFMSDREWR
jgi:hypothetical protein